MLALGSTPSGQEAAPARLAGGSVRARRGPAPRDPVPTRPLPRRTRHALDGVAAGSANAHADPSGRRDGEAAPHAAVVGVVIGRVRTMARLAMTAQMAVRFAGHCPARGFAMRSRPRRMANTSVAAQARPKSASQPGSPLAVDMPFRRRRLPAGSERFWSPAAAAQPLRGPAAVPSDRQPPPSRRRRVAWRPEPARAGHAPPATAGDGARHGDFRDLPQPIAPDIGLRYYRLTRSRAIRPGHISILRPHRPGGTRFRPAITGDPRGK